MADESVKIGCVMGWCRERHWTYAVIPAASARMVIREMDFMIGEV